MSPRVVVYTRPGCHLCEIVLEAVDRLCTELDVAWTSIDITGDESLLAAFGEQIPVTFVDGAQHDYWRINPDRLRAALA